VEQQSPPPVDHLGRFPVEAELGRGAMGVVYKGFHPGLEVPVAIKVLGDVYSGDAQFRRRFQREAAAIAALNHPGIVRIYDFDEDRESLFIVMEFVEGESLRSILQNKGRVTVHQALDITQQLLSAVGAAHSHNIVHRDLKPDNIAISSLGKVKVMDFGISKLLVDTGGLTGTDAIIGTPTYMSPEQVRGEAVDGRSDTYAVGCILYELLHGAPPFTGQLAAVLHSQLYNDPPESPAIPGPVMALIRKAMAKEPKKRFASCEEFSGALLQLDTAQLSAPPGAPAAPEAPPAKGLAFRLPGRAKPTGPPEPLEEQHTQARTTCTERDCAHHTEWMCIYQDRTGYGCGTWWCGKHISRVGNDAFCRRHASVIRALAVNAGTIREIKHLPAVNDRSLALAALVGGDIDKEITEILRRRYSSRRDVTVMADHAVRESRSGASIAWERNWSAARNQGYETRITLLVTAEEPSVVKLRVGSMEIFSGVPDWIGRRLAGKPANHSDRAHFRARLIETVSEAVDRPAPLAGGYHPARAEVGTPLPQALPDIDPRLLEGLVMRAFAVNPTSLPAFEIAKLLALPFASLEPVIAKLTLDRFLEAGGIASAASDNPVQERMTYTMTKQGRAMTEEMSKAGTHYLGPAPVTLADYNRMTTEVILPGLDPELVRKALDGLELAPGVEDAIRAAVNSRGSVFVYGSPGNGKTSLARRIPLLPRGRRGDGRLRPRRPQARPRPAARSPLAARSPAAGAGGRRVHARHAHRHLGPGGPRLPGAPPAEGERRRAADRRLRPPAGDAQADARPADGAPRAGHRPSSAGGQRAEGRDPLPGDAALLDQPDAERAARRGVHEAARLQGPDARSHAPGLPADLRAGAAAPRDPGQPECLPPDRAALRQHGDPGQPPARPPRKAGGRRQRARGEARAHARAGGRRLADAIRRYLTTSHPPHREGRVGV